MKRVAVAAIAIGLAAGAYALVPARGRRLSVEEIVARNVAARGGLDAWRKTETMVWVGHIESARAPVSSLQFELAQKRPNKTHLQINALGDKSVRAFDGVHGWKARSTRGRPEVQPYTPQESKFAQAGHGIDGPLIDHAAKGNSVSLAGVDEVQGHKAYHLIVRLAQGGEEEVWVDTGTYLEVRYDRTAEGPGGAPRRVSTLYDDYRSVEGLRIPFLLETGGGPGAPPDKMRIETVVLNAPLDDSRFGNPSALHPRNRGRPSAAAQGAAPNAPSSTPAAARDP